MLLWSVRKPGELCRACSENKKRNSKKNINEIHRINNKH